MTCKTVHRELLSLMEQSFKNDFNFPPSPDWAVSPAGYGLILYYQMCLVLFRHAVLLGYAF